MPDARPSFDVIILAGGRGVRLGGADKPGLVVGSSTMAATAARAAATAGARRIILVGPDRPDVTAVTAAAAAPATRDARADDARADDAPGGDAPDGDAPDGDAPDGDAPAGDATAGNAPDDGASAGNTPPRGAAAGDVHAVDAPDAASRAGDTRAGRLVVTREEPPGAGPVPALRAGLAEVGAPWVAVLAADLPFLGGDQVLSLLAAARDGRSAGAVIADQSGAEQWLAGCWRTGRLSEALAGYRGSSLRGLLAPLRPALVRDAAPADAPPPWLDCDTPAELAAARAWLAARPVAPHGTGPASAVSDPGQTD
ncbi:MAG TPA: NTP transferase domain-containing protein [Streptosporangiaceae bacterium]|nr:NTP transferase domain-containing protein [Streptosporangiaceae bacterium]